MFIGSRGSRINFQGFSGFRVKSYELRVESGSKGKPVVQRGYLKFGCLFILNKFLGKSLVVIDLVYVY